MGGEDAATLERPLPVTPETPVRERLRWEKELMGLYLSDHPMGEVAEKVGVYVTAYSGDLKDESLEGQRVVLGGIVTTVRTIITRTRSTMAAVTIEDLQGTVEVVVFPKTWEATAGTWTESSILLVAGRVDHRGDDVQLLADSVWDWDQVSERGPEEFAREVGSLDKRTRRPPGGGGQGGNGNGNGYGGWSGRGPVQPTAALVAPVRPAEPVTTYSEPPSTQVGSEASDEPALPDEARSRASAAAQAPSRPTEAAPGATLNVTFVRTAGAERVVSAMEAFKSVLRAHPGTTRVVVHVPAPGGTALPMELRGVAYDGELVAEVLRRVGDGVIDLQLA
jgi:hypothetical protein